MDVENKFMVTRDYVGEGLNLEIGTDIYTLLYIKYITYKNLIFSPVHCFSSYQQ